MILWPASCLYRQVTHLRNWAFDKGYLHSVKVSVPVISVGNITTGGTGKTPLVTWLMGWCEKEGIRAGVVSRGYKGRFSGEQRVDITSETYFGDEPLMMAKQFPNTPIYVGSNRVAVAQTLIAHEPVELIIADDGFQHRRLRRDIDIVVLDGTCPLETYKVLPAGRGRESISHLSRADFIVLNKMNLAASGQEEELRDLIKRYAANVPKNNIICGFYKLAPPYPLGGESSEPIELDGRKVVLVSAIGNPLAFENLVKRDFPGIVISKVVSFEDHHQFTESDIHYIKEQMQSVGACAVAVTEKDAIKLSSLVKEDRDFCVIPLFCEFDANITNLLRQVKELVRR